MTIQECFSRKKARGKSVLIPYATAGYPDRDTTVGLLDTIVKAGADLIELGIPFSDPLADGPTIQRSSFRALEGGMTVRGVLEILGEFRKSHATPVVLFTYLNPLLRFGVDDFLAEASRLGAQGLLLTDLPSGADPHLEDRITSSDLDLIRLLAPTTPRERLPRAARGGTGFLYYISRTGVTGARQELREELGREVDELRKTVALPIAVGFGISTPAQASMVAGVADGVVVGSALIDALDEGGVAGAGTFLRGLREGMDA